MDVTEPAAYLRLSGGAGHLFEVVEYCVAPDEDLGGWFESDGEMTV